MLFYVLELRKVLLFSFIQLYPKSSPKDNPRPSIRNFSHTQLDNTTLVSNVNAISGSTSGNSAPFNRPSQAQVIYKNSSPPLHKSWNCIFVLYQGKTFTTGLVFLATSFIPAYHIVPYIQQKSAV